MADAKKCDICGVLYEQFNSYIFHKNNKYKGKILLSTEDYGAKIQIDLCPFHAGMLDQLLENKPKIIHPNYVEQA